MPVSLKRIRATGRMVLITRCEVCDADHAPFGHGVDLRAAYKRLESGDKSAAKRNLGLWYCGEHRPDKVEP